MAVTVEETGDTISAAARAQSAEEVAFDANETTATLTVSTDDDKVKESDSVITATVVDGDDYDLGTPSFAKITVTDDDCTVTGVSNDTSLGTVSGSATVTCGDDVTLTAHPASGTKVESWSGCTSVSDDKTTCTVTTSMSVRDVTATATFKSESCTVTGASAPADGSLGTVSGSDDGRLRR